MAAVSNSSAIVLYAKIGRLDLLEGVYQQLLIPHSVYREVVEQGAGRPGASDVGSAAWITVCAVGEIPADLSMLHEGEAEAILLAQQRHLTVLLDDGLARRKAATRQVALTGSAGTLVRAKELGLIATVKPLLDRLVDAGLRLGPAAYRQILQEANEEEQG